MKTSQIPAAFMLAACSLAVAACAQTAPVSIAVNTASPGAAIPIDFSGLSFERGTLNSNNAGAAGYLFSPSNPQLVTLFQNLSIKNLRIGGGSVDDENVVGTNPDHYLGIDALFRFSQASGTNVLYSLRLLNPGGKITNLMSEDANAAGYIWSNYKNDVTSFAIGNEPDFHSYHTSDPLIYETTPGQPGTAFPSYLSDWTNFANAVEAAAPGATFSGPDSGAYAPPITYNGVPWTISFANAENGSSNVADITQHLYVGGSPGTTTATQAIDNMLSPDWVNGTGLAKGPEGASTYTPYPYFYANALAGIANDNFPYRLTESDDYLTGINGASNTFSSALWALDYMHWWAQSGAAGVNFHNKQWIFTDTIVPSPNPCVGSCGNYQTSPKGYGIKAFDLGGHGLIEPVTISNPNNVNLTAYAAGSGQDLFVTIINKTHSSTNDAIDAAVTIQPNGFQAASAAAIVLTDGQPGNAGLIPTTLGSAAIPNNARWAGQWMPLAPESNGSISLTVAATTAAVVRIHAASNEAGPLAINQNGALQVFATDASGNVWSNQQMAADVPNSGSSSWSGWANAMTGITAQGSAAVAKNENNTVEIFVPTSGGDIYHNAQLTPGGAWSGWSDLGGNGITNLRVANNADGSLTVFGIGTNGDLWYASENAPEVGWSGWTDLSGQAIQPGFVIAQNLNGLLQAFGVDVSGNAWTNTQAPDATWSGWTQLAGATLTPNLAIARNIDGRVEFFALDALGRVWQNAQQVAGSAFAGWSLVPGHRLQTGFTVGENANGCLEIFGAEQNGRAGSNSGAQPVWALAQLAPGGAWGDWLKLGGAVNSSLVVGNTLDGRIQLFAKGNNGDTWSAWQTAASGATWSPWSDFGGNGLSF